jgi:hypothetical protein
MLLCLLRLLAMILLRLELFKLTLTGNLQLRLDLANRKVLGLGRKDLVLLTAGLYLEGERWALDLAL